MQKVILSCTVNTTFSNRMPQYHGRYAVIIIRRMCPIMESWACWKHVTCFMSRGAGFTKIYSHLTEKKAVFQFRKLNFGTVWWLSLGFFCFFSPPRKRQSETIFNTERCSAVGERITGVRYEVSVMPQRPVTFKVKACMAHICGALRLRREAAAPPRFDQTGQRNKP